LRVYPASGIGRARDRIGATNIVTAAILNEYLVPNDFRDVLDATNKPLAPRIAHFSEHIRVFSKFGEVPSKT